MTGPLVTLLPVGEASLRRIGWFPTCTALNEAVGTCGYATTHVRLITSSDRSHWVAVCPEHTETPWTT